MTIRAKTAALIERLQEQADNYRFHQNGQVPRGTYVLIFGLKVIGCSTDPLPSDYQPDVFAVGPDGVFMATGGNAQSGAEVWFEIKP